MSEQRDKYHRWWTEELDVKRDLQRTITRMEFDRIAALEAQIEYLRDAACQFICEMDAELCGRAAHWFELPDCVDEYRERLLEASRKSMFPEKAEAGDEH